MAKKKKKEIPELKTRLKVNEADRYEVIFYNGRRKATPDEIKANIKANFSKINPNTLPPEYRAYFGKVKGGKNRASKALRIDGKLTSDEFKKTTGLSEVARLRGFKNENELLKNDPELYEATRQLYNSPDGLKYPYTSDDVLKALSNFSGVIKINGREHSQIKAIEKIDSYDKLIKRRYGAFFIKYFVYYKKGGGELEISLPPERVIKEKDFNEFIEFIEEQDDDEIEIIGSEMPEEPEQEEPPKKEKRRRKQNKYRCIIAIEIMVKKTGKKSRRQKTVIIEAQNKKEAAQILKADFKNCIIISIERI